MKIYKVEITKKDLSHVPEKEQILFFQVGTMLNEITMLHKITWFCNKEGLTDIENKGQNAQSLFFLSLLIGKLWECWEALHKTFFKSGLSKEYEQLLSDEEKANLKNIKKYFGKNEWIYKIRKKFSFHYDPNEISKQINELPDDLSLEMYLNESQGNSLYHASSILYLRGILKAIDESDERIAIDKCFSETLQVAGNLLVFFSRFLDVLSEKYLDLHLEEIEIPDPPSVGDLYIPYFVRR